MPRRPNPRRIRKHYSYTVEEAATALDVAKGSVRRWIKSGLSALTDQRPTLILGSDLIAFLQGRRAKRQKCAIDEAYCFSCRRPRKPAFAEVEITSLKGGTARMWAICEVCGTDMHKPVSASRLSELEAHVTVAFSRDHERIGER